MALARTTLSAAVAVNDTTITVASATSIVAGRLIQIDNEWMQVQSHYSSGTSIPVLRGRNGTAVAAHNTTAGVVHGDAADYANPPAQSAASVNSPLNRVRVATSITATGSFVPTAGQDTHLILNGTSVIALTLAAPTKEMEGDILYVSANGAAAHTITFTGGLAGAGTSYDVLTMNGTGPCTVGPIMAVNEKWQLAVTIGAAGTLTNVTATLA